ncbi:hypothetical protein RHSP_75915 [Rhizobium freirei PRF 81]|uniref:Uncharacterized protein n=1 Tax=Rhizobium freirei PRF 81 TaxID=363754 RepID=N6V5E9_9HYPH|nr:hypothetical protein RHSP_75915 [Rhizobium freirei PRF 81]
MRLPEEHRAGFGVLRDAVDGAVVGGNLQQVLVDAVERPGVEIDVILDRNDEAGLGPGRDVLMAADDDVRGGLSFGGKGQRLFEIVPAGIGFLLDGDLQVLPLERGLALQLLGCDLDGVEAIDIVRTGAAGPYADGNVLGECEYGSRGQNGGRDGDGFQSPQNGHFLHLSGRAVRGRFENPRKRDHSALGGKHNGQMTN